MGLFGPGAKVNPTNPPDPSRLVRPLCFALLLFAATGAGAQQVGAVAFPNSGAPAAQRSFLYGLAQLHNFEYDDAARAFRAAQEIDPGFAMAFWGEAMTRNHPVWMEQDLGAARRILERLGPSPAARIASGKTERERAYLGAVETLYGAGDKRARDLAYLDAMRQLHAAWPDDVDAAAFYGLALLGSAHNGRDDATYLRAAEMMERPFAAHPDHPGLAHYLIHSYDDPAHARQGLPAARRYFTIAPAAPHALHMTSHIYLAAGMWDEVVAANEQATRVAAERARSAGRTPGSCGHANMWLMYGYLQQGRPDEARRVLDLCRASATSAGGLAVRAAEQDPLDPDNIPAASYVQMWSRYIIDTARWDDPLVKENLALGDLAGATVTRAFVRVLAAAGRTLRLPGRHDESVRSGQAGADGLKSARAEFQAARGRLDAFLATRAAGRDRYRTRAEVLDREVEALVLLSEQQVDAAVAALRAAAAAEAAMPVEFGPPFVDKPADELLGDVLLGLGRKPEARAAYESTLERAPNRAASVAGLARTRD